MNSGSVRFVARRGFGFIASDDGRDIYFHVTNLKVRTETVHPGDRVTFETSTTPRGIQAVGIVVDASEEKILGNADSTTHR